MIREGVYCFSSWFG